MRIAHVIPALVKGGAERVVVDLANCAVAKGDDVTLILSHPSPPHLLTSELRPEVKVLYVWSHPVGAFLRYAALPPWLIGNWRQIQSLDVVHCHLSFGSAAATLIRWIRILRGETRPAIVETFHAVGMPLAKLKLRLLARLAKQREAIALVAEDSFWRRFQAVNPQALVKVIPNGITLRETPATPSETSWDRQSLAIPMNCRCIVGTLGRLVPERKPEQLIRVFAEISTTVDADVHFVMGGAGPCLGELKTLANELGLKEQIHFPGLIVDSKTFFYMCNLYISVNVGPITGIAGLEAALFGLPVIAFQAREDYHIGATDWIWSATRPREVAAEAVRLLRNPSQLRQLTDRQRRFVIDHHGADAMRDQYGALYRRALERVKTGGRRSKSTD